MEIKNFLVAEKTEGTTSSSLTVTVQSNVEAMYDKLLNKIQADLKEANDIIDNEKLNSIVSKHIDMFSTELDGDEETARKTLKCLQSKRSRAKNKPLTAEIAKIIIVSATAELLLKKSFNLVSQATSTGLDYDVDNMDTNELRKAIRNVQSRKSIMKSKADFDETSEQWQQLLVVEEQLKTKRDGATIPMALKNKLSEDISGMTKPQLVEYINELKSMVE